MLPLLAVTWLQLALVGLVVTQLTILSVTIYLHRAQAHRSLTLHPALAHLVRAWLWLTTGMSTLEWVAVHRKHHAHCETNQDPHSPAVHGFWKVFLTGVRLYTKEAKNPETLSRFGKGAPNDRLEHALYRRGALLGPVLLILLNLCLFGAIKGGALSAVQLLWIPFWAAGVINGLAHTKGYRNFPSADRSKNLLPWGVWIGGEELHNNHHAHPTSAKLSYKKWEVDLGWGAIRVLQTLGLAKVHRAIHRPKLAEPATCSPALLTSLAHHHMTVSQWFHAVWANDIAEVKKNERLTTAQAKLLENAFRDVSLSPTTASLLESQSRLAALRSHWIALQHLWKDPSASQSELVRRLSTWCENAEASGIEALRGLSLRIRSLAVPA